MVGAMPAHDDNSPSLSVRELTDGRVLVHCFGGCEVESVLTAIGLEFDALFPGESEHSSPLTRRRLISPSQALEVLRDESLLLVVCASALERRETLDEQTRDRLLRSAARISLILDEVRS